MTNLDFMHDFPFSDEAASERVKAVFPEEAPPPEASPGTPPKASPKAQPEAQPKPKPAPQIFEPDAHYYLGDLARLLGLSRTTLRSTAQGLGHLGMEDGKNFIVGSSIPAVINRMARNRRSNFREVSVEPRDATKLLAQVDLLIPDQEYGITQLLSNFGVTPGSFYPRLDRTRTTVRGKRRFLTGAYAREILRQVIPKIRVRKSSSKVVGRKRSKISPPGGWIGSSPSSPPHNPSSNPTVHETVEKSLATKIVELLQQKINRVLADFAVSTKNMSPEEISLIIQILAKTYPAS